MSPPLEAAPSPAVRRLAERGLTLRRRGDRYRFFGVRAKDAAAVVADSDGFHLLLADGSCQASYPFGFTEAPEPLRLSAEGVEFVVDQGVLYRARGLEDEHGQMLGVATHAEQQLLGPDMRPLAPEPAMTDRWREPLYWLSETQRVRVKSRGGIDVMNSAGELVVSLLPSTFVGLHLRVINSELLRLVIGGDVFDVELLP